jgi:hypothetical protein
MSRKIRITQYGVEGLIDRLVESETEFKHGPDKTFFGPVRIDFLAENQIDMQGLIEYLQRLTGQLPIEEKQKKLPKDKNKPLNVDAAQQLVEDAFLKCKTQEELVDYLRELNFTFIDRESLEDWAHANDFTIEIDPKHKKYQFMIRTLRLAKNPAKDKHDLQVFFGIKFVGKKFPKVRIYEMGKFTKTVKLKWGKDQVNFKPKVKLYKFPEPMSYDERNKWRGEHRRVANDPSYEPSVFYTKWYPFVTFLKPEEEVLKFIKKGKNK